MALRMAPLLVLAGVLSLVSACSSAVEECALGDAGCNELSAMVLYAYTAEEEFTPLYTRIFWVDFGLDLVQRHDIYSEETRTLVTDAALLAPHGIVQVPASGDLFWTVKAIALQTSDRDGNGFSTPASSVFNDGYDIELHPDTQELYVGDDGNASIVKLDQSGQNLANVIVTGGGLLFNPRGIALDAPNDHIYWVDLTAVNRVNFDDTGAVNLVSGLTSPRDIELDISSGKMYWTDTSAGKVQRANLDGSGLEDLATGTAPYGLALDLQRGLMYWSDATEGKILSANLDGSDRKEVVSGLGTPRHIALGN